MGHGKMLLVPLFRNPISLLFAPCDQVAQIMSLGSGSKLSSNYIAHQGSLLIPISLPGPLQICSIDPGRIGYSLSRRGKRGNLGLTVLKIAQENLIGIALEQSIDTYEGGDGKAENFSGDSNYWEVTS
jgi:hypothetical protein